MYIAIEGNIGAGKTSLAQLLADDLHAHLRLEPFEQNPFLPHYYNAPERYALPTELFFLVARYEQLAHNAATKPHSTHTIADYIFIKTLLFAGNSLSGDERALFERTYNALAAGLPPPDLLVYLHRPTHILLQQIKKRGRDYETHITPQYLDAIEQTYRHHFANLPTEQPSLWLDLADTDFLDDPHAYQHLRERILQHLPTT